MTSIDNSSNLLSVGTYILLSTMKINSSLFRLPPLLHLHDMPLSVSGLIVPPGIVNVNTLLLQL